MYKWRETESNRRHMELQSIALPTELPSQIAGAGFEPTTFGLWARRATELLHPALIQKEDVGFEPTHAFTRLTVFKTVPFSRTWVILQNSPYGIRTRVTAVKRRCLNPLTNGPFLQHILLYRIFLLCQHFFNKKKEKPILDDFLQSFFKNRESKKLLRIARYQHS